MIAPQSITSNLRRMSDQQLAQYAKMHANDPYVFPLAFQESQDRKNMRSEAMARQSGQMPPPVVQQDLAQMMPQQAPQVSQQAQLPEEQGIGALPAQNMQGMAGGGITGEHHFRSGGTDYKAITDADIEPILKGDVPLTAEELAAQRRTLVTPMNQEMETAYKPYLDKLASRQTELEGRKSGNIQNALLTAGLGMMAGTSPYAFANIGKGGLEGLQVYQSAQKADQAAQDALDHSQMLMMQAQRAERSGNNRDATMMIDAAQRQKELGFGHKMTALQLKNTSQYQAGQLANTELQRQIEAGKAAEIARHDKQLEELYYTPMGEAAKAKKDLQMSPDEIKFYKAQTLINNDDTIAGMNKSLQDDIKVGNITFGTPEYYQRLDAIHEQKLPIYQSFGVKPPSKPSQTITKEEGTKTSSSIFDRLFNSAPTKVQTGPGLGALLGKDEDSLSPPVDARATLPYSQLFPTQ